MTGTLHEDQYTFLITSRSFLLRMRNISDKSLKKIKTHFEFSNVLENRTFYEIMCKKYCRDEQATDDNMAHAHCVLDI